ncbi:MAG: hypothetical protein GAK28_00569 [Luteibacter sp.]|uniref:hypothetical protein n=1 Tax=Luteibacter sp. TaxID=1886636 RepID=UPI00138607AC|nr:hypothetical protein [Luteibacter sp.]KAF1008937.1 MAG: hypothetical protein GAK28_00569 [Luteibacter sp.]
MGKRAIPSRFQLNDDVRAAGVRGTVAAITFTVIAGQGKVLYDVRHSGGVLTRVSSEHMEPARPKHLHIVVLK